MSVSIRSSARKRNRKTKKITGNDPKGSIKADKDKSTRTNTGVAREEGTKREEINQRIYTEIKTQGHNKAKKVSGDGSRDEGVVEKKL